MYSEMNVCYNLARRDDDQIKSVISDIKDNFIFLGFLLSEFKSSHQWKYLNYSSFDEYCDVELHMSKSTAYNLIAVHERFCVGQALKLKMYEPYSYSQLVELVNVSDSDFVMYPSDMSVRRIKKLKKANCRVSNSLKTFQTSGKSPINHLVDDGFLCSTDFAIDSDMDKRDFLIKIIENFVSSIDLDIFVSDYRYEINIYRY